MQLKSIIVIFSLLIFFISSTGVVVFEHHCSKSGDFIGFYTGVDHDCGEVMDQSCSQETEVDSHCCQPQVNEDIPNVSSKCCTTDVSLIQIHSDYSLSYSVFDFDNKSLPAYVDNNDLRNLSNRQVKVVRGPPDLYLTQNKKRANIQVYLI